LARVGCAILEGGGRARRTAAVAIEVLATDAGRAHSRARAGGAGGGAVGASGNAACRAVLVGSAGAAGAGSADRVQGVARNARQASVGSNRGARGARRRAVLAGVVVGGGDLGCSRRARRQARVGGREVV